MNAEREAQKEGKGLHCTKNKPVAPTINDLSQVDESMLLFFILTLVSFFESKFKHSYNF
jgi:hypothetical protein